jgi:hypothetical protein
MLVPEMEMKDPQEPLRLVQRDGHSELEHVTALRMMERFPRPRHASPFLMERFSLTTYPVMRGHEFEGNDTGIKVTVKKRVWERAHIWLFEKNNFHFEMGNCILSVDVARIPPKIITDGFWGDPELGFVHSASLFHKFSAGMEEKLVSIEQDKEWKAEMPCMKVIFYPALVVR